MKALNKVIEKKEYYEAVVIPGKDALIDSCLINSNKCKASYDTLSLAYNECMASNDLKTQISETKDKIIIKHKNRIKAKNAQMVIMAAIEVLIILLIL